jgi:hypothetical protein
MMLRRIASWLAPLVVFALVFWTHDASYMRNATDTKWAVHVAMSLVKQHDANLDEYRDLLASNGNFAIEDVGGHLYSLYPLGAPILAAPLVYVAECYRSFENRPSLENEIAHQIPYDLNRTCASFIVALAAMIVFSFVRLRHGSVVAAITTIVLAFGTAAWSTASRGLWQHGPSLLAIALAIYCAERAAKNDRWIVVAALPISFAFLARPSNALVIVLFTVYVAICHRRRLLGYGSIGAAIAVCFFWYSWRTYGHLVPTYYRPSALAELSGRVVTEVDSPRLPPPN